VPSQHGDDLLPLSSPFFPPLGEPRIEVPSLYFHLSIRTDRTLSRLFSLSPLFYRLSLSPIKATIYQLPAVGRSSRLWSFFSFFFFFFPRSSPTPGAGD